MFITKELKNQINLFRKTHNYSVEELCYLLGVSRSYYNNIMCGVNRISHNFYSKLLELNIVNAGEIKNYD